MPEIKQGQSTAVLAQFDLLSMGEGEGKRGGRSLTYFPLGIATACDTRWRSLNSKKHKGLGVAIGWAAGW